IAIPLEILLVGVIVSSTVFGLISLLNPIPTIQIDGSSTVYPITQAVAEDFQIENPDIRITVGISGTGGGFKRFRVGETDINDASRQIKTSEAEECTTNGIEYTEFQIALDGIAIVVNSLNHWALNMTVEELNATWHPNSTVTLWSDIRPGWPDETINLYGPGTDSGTFDYFTNVIVGEEGASRPDFTASEDDNILVQGIAGDQYALGYFGFAYYIENTDILNVVAIDVGSGPVTPSTSTINSGEYTPLSRPLFIYVNHASIKRDEVRDFVEFYFKNAERLVSEVGYTPLPAASYTANLITLGSI
ncbi:MAG: PstS family phosphate ABC transporter substrate-binding protein, partial [Promethearchaeota archaeon]